MKKYLGILLIGLFLFSGSTVFAQTSGSGIFAVEVIGSPTTWTQGTNKNVTWKSAGVGTKFDVLVCYLRPTQSDACFFAYKNLTNTGSAISVRVGTNVPLNSMAYVKVRKAGTNTVMAKSSQFKVVAPRSSNLQILSGFFTPPEQFVVVDEESDTDGVTLLRGTLQADGNADLNIKSLPVTLTTVGASSVGAVANRISFIVGGEEIASEVVALNGISGVVVFDDLDLDLYFGEPLDFAIEADINDIEAGSFDEGDTLKVDLTTTNRSLINVFNENGVQLSSAQKIGTAIGKAQTFVLSGILPKFVSSSSYVTRGELANDDIGTFEIRFDVEALEDDVYLSNKGTSVGYMYRVEKNGVPVTSTAISAVVTSSAEMSSPDTYRVPEGDTERFTLTVVVSLGSGLTSGPYRLVLTGIKWDKDMDATPDNIYSNGLENFKTPYQILALEGGNVNQMASIITSLENILANLKISFGLSN